MSASSSEAIPSDYDHDPDRFRTNVESTIKYSLSGDVHESVAEWLVSQQYAPILDIGCGEGRLVQLIQRQNLPIFALDKSSIMLQAVTAPRTLADANDLPFPDCCFGAVTALYMLYHLHEPRNALVETRRVLRAGGVFVVCVPSRYNDPELASILPQRPLTFDAENGLEMTGDYFEIIKVESWDAPLVSLPDKNALVEYLRGRRLSEENIQKAASTIPVPLNLTKRGVLIYARKSC